MMRIVACAGAAVLELGLLSHAATAMAWGDEGHEVIGRIAEHYLKPAVRTRVQALLAGDASGLTSRDIPHESTWADKYRDSDRGSSKIRYQATRDWHFIDLEIVGADLSGACDGRRPLPAGMPASKGPPDCVVDKIEQFFLELKDPRTADPERRLALEFLLHFVGDVHQPLHASDDHDQGGNRKQASGPGLPSDNLHHDWDVEFVERLGANDEEIAQRLISNITQADRNHWSRGGAEGWALDTYRVSKAHAYGLLPPPSGAYYRLPDAYIADALHVTAEQLSKAGVRLAWLLNRALG